MATRFDLSKGEVVDVEEGPAGSSAEDRLRRNWSRVSGVDLPEGEIQKSALQAIVDAIPNDDGSGKIKTRMKKIRLQRMCDDCP